MTAPAARLRRLGDGTSHRLDDPRSTIGRSDATITIGVPAVSRLHARVDRTPVGYTITDCDSRNGTFVNGDRLGSTARPLRDGDEVVIAGIETFRFEDPLATPMAPAIGRLRGVWIDATSGAVWVDAQPVEPPLSARQQALLELLAVHEGEVVSREQIVDSVWSDVAADGVSAEAIDALVKRLRSRLRPLQLHGDYLDVVRGRGLRLVEPS